MSLRSFFKNRHLWRHLIITFIAVGIMGFFAFLTVMLKPLQPIKRLIADFSFTDIYYEILGEGEQGDTCRFITIVDMTQQTNRSEIANTLNEIEAAKPKVLGVDVCFDNPGEDLAGNDALIEAVDGKDNMVFSVKMLNWKDETTGWDLAIHSFFTEVVDVVEGTTNMPRQLYDSMKRKVPLAEKYKGKYQPSFAKQVAKIYSGKEIFEKRTDDLNINFSPTVFRTIKPEEVKNHPELIEDQIVLYGAKLDDRDTHWTPLGKISGVELLAYSIQTLVMDKEVKNIEIIPTFIISLLLIFLIQVIQSTYLERMTNSKHLFVKYICGSTYAISLITCFFVFAFVGLGFALFIEFNINFNFGWVSAVITFLSTARNMYGDIRKYLEVLSNRMKVFSSKQ